MGVCLLYLNVRVLGVFPMFLWFDLVHGWFGDVWVVLVLIACGCVSVFLRFRLTVVDGIYVCVCELRECHESGFRIVWYDCICGFLVWCFGVLWLCSSALCGGLGLILSI